MAFWSMAYKFGWATKVQLKEAASKGKITAEQYQTITGEAYTA